MRGSSKADLRRELLAQRRAIEETEKRLLDMALCKKIAAHRAFLEADALLLYLPVRGEPDLTPLLATANERRLPVFLPRCEGDGMRFLRFEGEPMLQKDRFGILSPQSKAAEATPTLKTLCIVPGLAAGRDGTRLGYGGGFYDRFLPHFEGYALFPLYERFVFDTLPHEAHDHLIDPANIITEKGEFGHGNSHSTAPKV